MQLAFIDFETFWSTDHSLSRLSPIEYVMHRETELISCSVKIDNAPTDVIFGEAEIKRVLPCLDWSTMYAIAHNMSGFDSMIMAWRLGLKPAMWGCTLAMARPLYAKTVGLSLAKQVAHHRIGVKQDAVLHSTKGRHLVDFSPEEIAAMETYNKADTEQCAALFHKLKGNFTPAELWHLDCNIRMLVEPKFQVDTGLLDTALSVERSNKHKHLIDLARMLRAESAAAIGVDPEIEWSDETSVAEWVRAQLASAPRFAALLTERGVPVPMKASPTDDKKQVPALAKTDEEFIALQESDDEVIAAAARARLAIKSTLVETRIEAFLQTASHLKGKLPVPIHYVGADTTGRDSGFLYNPQNLPSIRDTPRTSDALRKSLRAPKGFKVGVADQSGIELRVNHFLWKVPQSMALYAASPDKADLYKAFAADNLFRIPADQISKQQRQIGKVAQLGLGFGAGAATFQRIARNMAGLDMKLTRTPAPVEWFDEDGHVVQAAREAYAAHTAEITADRVVMAWRQAYAPITEGWKTCGESLSYVSTGSKRAVDPWGLVTTAKDALVLPSGRHINYPNLRFIDDGQTWPDGRSKKSWVYADGRHKTYLTGPKVDENIVQALARDSVFECALRFFKLTKLRPIMRVHDELVYMFPESEAEALLDELQGVMRTPPSWWPEIVLWSAGDIADSYGDAK